MSTIAQFGLPVEEFALRETLPEHPGVTVEVERVVALGDDRVMPFCWAADGDLRAFEDALRGDPTTDGVERLSTLDDGRFYRMDWVDRIELVLHALTEHDAVVLDARGSAEGWSLRVLFPDRDAISETRSFCEASNVDFDLRRIYEMTDTERYGQYGLTDDQYETLLAALESGYYEVPRAAATRDLADDFGLSHQAVSERLRRAHANLIENALTVSDAASAPDRTDPS